MIAIWYVALAALLFVGIKFSKKNEWNEDNMSFGQTKCFLGFCAVIICFHHMSQQTSASWLNPRFIQKGLEIFVTAGYPMVAMFLFCSGFGLYKSAKTKPDFFKRFLPSRIIPILIPTILVELVYIYLRNLRHIPVRYKNPFIIGIGTHETVNPYFWYIPCIILLYILFYIGFGLIKKDWAGILMVAIGTAGWISFCLICKYGTWWFNTIHMFLLGILVSKYEKKVFDSFKKHYVFKAILTVLLAAFLWYAANNGGNFYFQFTHTMWNEVNGYKADLFVCIFQVLYSIAFVMVYYVLSMKMKVGNPVLKFLGKITLELYLVHGIFVQMFSYYMIKEPNQPIYYIKNLPLFVLVVLACSIPVAFGLSIIDKKVGKILRPKKAN